MDGVIGSDLLDRLAATDRLHGDSGLELGTMVAAPAYSSVGAPFRGGTPPQRLTMGTVQESQTTSDHLIGYRLQFRGNGVLVGLAPAVHLLGEQAALAAVPTHFCRIQASGFEHNRELIGRAQPLRDLLAGRHHLPLQPPGLAPLVEGDRVNPRSLGDFGHSLAMGRRHHSWQREGTPHE